MVMIEMQMMLRSADCDYFCEQASDCSTGEYL